MKQQKGFTLIELLIVVAIIGIIAAIAIPSLLRARVSANEAAAIGDSRTVSSGYAAYQAANGGLFDSQLQCLATPWVGCIPAYPATAPAFLDSQITSLITKQGYNHQLLAGPAPAVIPTQASLSSVLGFCYQSTPASQNQSGVRGFGIDGSGVLCNSVDGTATPNCQGAGLGLLVVGCTPL